MIDPDFAKGVELQNAGRSAYEARAVVRPMPPKGRV